MPSKIKSCDYGCGSPDTNLADGSTRQLTGCDFGYSYSYNQDIGICGQTLGVTLKNSSTKAIKIIITGVVDDDVSFNNVVYEDGLYCFFAPDCAWGQFICNFTNGAHSFNFQKTLAASESILIKGIDNGFGGYISCNITFSAV